MLLSGEFRSDRVKVDEGFEHWLLKFNGISSNRETRLAVSRESGKIEFAYASMALVAGAGMPKPRESNRAIRRESRMPSGSTLCRGGKLTPHIPKMQ